MARRKKKKYLNKILTLVLVFLTSYFVYYFRDEWLKVSEGSTDTYEHYDLENIPEYNGEAYIYLNDNVPEFTDEEKSTQVFESYSNLDSLGRCGVAFANVSKETMPTEDRESIGQVKPSGWHTVKYDIVSGKYLYNRCHLIGY